MIIRKASIVILLALTAFEFPAWGQQTSINRLNSCYDSFKYHIKQYGEDSSKNLDSFEEMLNYYNSLSNVPISDRESLNELLEVSTRWEEILNEISRDYGRSFFLRLQKTAKENNRLVGEDTPRSDPEVLNSLYDGGELIREQEIIDKADLFLTVLFHRAQLSARLGNIDDVYLLFQTWLSIWDKWGDTYSSKDEFDKCIFVLSNYLANTMFANGLQSQGIGLLMSLNNYYSEIENKSPELEECIEDAETWIITLLGAFGDELTQMHNASRASFDSFWRYYDINNYLIQLGDYAKAIRNVDADKSVEFLEKAKRLIEGGHVGKNGRPASRKTKSFVYNELSSSYLRMKLHDKQLIAIQKAVFEDGDYFNPVHYHNLASSYYDNGDLINAMEIYQLLETKNELNIDSYNNLALITYLQGNYHQSTEYAEKYFNEVISIFQNDTRYMTPRVREQFFSYNYHLRYFYNTLSMFAMNNPMGTELAFDASLYQKGLLVRMNNETRRRIYASDNEELKQAYLDYLNSLVYEDPEKATLVENTLQSLFPKFLNFSDNSFKLSWKDIRFILKDNEVAIEFVTFLDYEKKENRYAALVLKRGYDSPRMVELCSCNALDSIFKSVDAYGCPRIYDNISDPSTMIWGPLTDILTDVKTIYYSPCEKLSQINLDIMTLGGRGESMNHAFRMVRMLSTANLLEQRPFSFVNTSLMGGFEYGMVTSRTDSVQGDNFRGFNRDTGWEAIESIEEIEGIKQSLNKKSTVSLITGTDADETTIKSISGNSPSILHFATHGFYLGLPAARKFAYYSNYEDRWIPEDVRCGLILSGANDAWLGRVPAGGNDGTLTAEEINGLDLSKTELVVLSACQTGLGENTSEGTYGLMRAFKNAGVGSIIMSLWEVDDSATVLFMNTFYKQLASGKERHLAYNKAQETVKRRYPLARYWAAFVMID